MPRLLSRVSQQGEQLPLSLVICLRFENQRPPLLEPMGRGVIPREPALDIAQRNLQ